MHVPESTLVFIVGPPAVGKMTVGHELAQRTGLKLFHNHHTIDLILPLFPFGTPAFHRLVGEFRRRIFEEVAASDLSGLIFTYVLAFDHPSDAAYAQELAAIFRTRGGRVLFVELEATQEERLRRNATDFRLAQKPSKRDLAASRQRLLEYDLHCQLNSRGEFDDQPDYLRINNTELEPSVVAEQIIEYFYLRRRDTPPPQA